MTPTPGLRERAEAAVRAPRGDIAGMSPEEIQRLVHELQVHHIELEMQNEELRRAQAELAESRDRFSHLYDFAPIGDVTLDHDGTVLEANLTLATMLGVERGKLIGRKFTRFVPRDEQDTLYLHQRAVVGGDLKHTCDLHLHRADGNDFTVRMETIGLRDEVSGVCHSRSAISKITERERAEQSLRESEERYRTVVEHAVHGIIIHQDNRICFANAAVLQMFGYSTPDELLGHDNFEKLVAPEERPTLRARTATLYRGEHVPPHEGWRGIRKNGTDIWISTSVTRIEWQGRPAIVAFYSDITARKQAEQALTELNASLEQQIAERTLAVREREQRLHAILNTAPDAIITMNAQGGIQSVNPAAEQIFGYTAAEMIGRNVNFLMPVPFREEPDLDPANTAETGMKQIVGIGREVVAQRNDGFTFPVELMVSEVDDRNLFTGILRDITRRRELEREVVEIASREQRRIGQDLHDSVGQELTALNILAGDLAETLREDPSSASKLVEQMVRGLKRSQQELRSVMRGLLPVAVDAEGLMAALADLADHVQEEGKVNCTFDCPEPVSVADNLAATHLFLIAQEAVHNAVKHARSRNIRISLRSDGPLVLRVQDDGIGNSPRPAGNRGGLGMRIMQNRAAIIGARLTIQPADSTGTLVACVLERKNHGT